MRIGDGDTTELIPITPDMIRAGVEELRERRYGEKLSDVVYEIYLAMEIQRRSSPREANRTA